MCGHIRSPHCACASFNPLIGHHVCTLLPLLEIVMWVLLTVDTCKTNNKKIVVHVLLFEHFLAKPNVFWDENFHSGFLLSGEHSREKRKRRREQVFSLLGRIFFFHAVLWNTSTRRPKSVAPEVCVWKCLGSNCHCLQQLFWTPVSALAFRRT